MNTAIHRKLGLGVWGGCVLPGFSLLVISSQICTLSHETKWIIHKKNCTKGGKKKNNFLSTWQVISISLAWIISLHPSVLFLHYAQDSAGMQSSGKVPSWGLRPAPGCPVQGTRGDLGPQFPNRPAFLNFIPAGYSFSLGLQAWVPSPPLTPQSPLWSKRKRWLFTLLSKASLS